MRPACKCSLRVSRYQHLNGLLQAETGRIDVNPNPVLQKIYRWPHSNRSSLLRRVWPPCRPQWVLQQDNFRFFPERFCAKFGEYVFF